MRDKELKKRIMDACAEPDQRKKDAFIRSIRSRQTECRISFTDMLMLEFRYIRKRIWVLSMLIIALSLILFRQLDEDRIMILGDMIPLLAGVGMIEVLRAHMHGMSEIETTTLISAKGALFAKMTIIGIVHLITVSVLAVILTGAGGGNALINVSRLVIPYLVTTISCMEAERTGFGRDNIWCCLAIAVLVIVVRELLYSIGITDGLDAGILVIITLMLMGIQTYEIRKTFRQEEYAWN